LEMSFKHLEVAMACIVFLFIMYAAHNSTLQTINIYKILIVLLNG
jgi:hypothetical protein